jgi:hypothetical protein
MMMTFYMRPFCPKRPGDFGLNDSYDRDVRISSRPDDDDMYCDIDFLWVY